MIMEFQCGDCGHVFEVMKSFVPYGDKEICPHCEVESAIRIPSAIGGYSGSTGGSSTRPARSTAMKSVKPFTGTK